MAMVLGQAGPTHGVELAENDVEAALTEAQVVLSAQQTGCTRKQPEAGRQYHREHGSAAITLRQQHDDGEPTEADHEDRLEEVPAELACEDDLALRRDLGFTNVRERVGILPFGPAQSDLAQAAEDLLQQSQPPGLDPLALDAAFSRSALDQPVEDHDREPEIQD